MPVLNRPVSLGMNQFMIRLNDKAENLYVYHLLKSQYGEKIIKQKVQGAVTKTITKDAIRSLPIMLPDITLQKHYKILISKYYGSLNTYISSLDYYNNLFNSLLQRAFRGELKFNDKAFRDME
jgi:type I restriction enzyme S subunit